MTTNSVIEKLALMVASIAVICSFIQVRRSTFRLERTFEQFRLLDFLRRCPPADELPLTQPKRWLKQRNAGRDPCQEPYPEIKLQKFLGDSELYSSQRGIW